MEPNSESLPQQVSLIIFVFSAVFDTYTKYRNQNKFKLSIIQQDCLWLFYL